MARRTASPAWVAVASVLALVLLAAGFAGLLRDRSAGLVRQAAEVSGVPVTVIRPAGGALAPGVVVAHGFAGSAVLMDGLATSLARTGQAVALLDFAGHGRNPEPLPAAGTVEGRDLLAAQVAAVASWLAAQEFANAEPIALVGHSMGAGAVVRAAVADPASYRATVALSLPSADAVPAGMPAVPRNLLLLWGAAEQQRFAEAALQAVRAGHPGAAPGQRYGDYAEGTARLAREVPGAEHLSILWRSDTARWTAQWVLDRPVPVAMAPRMLHTAAAVIGGAFALVPLSLLLLGNRRPVTDRPVGAGRAVLAMLAAAVAASLFAAAAAPLGERVPLAVGGHLALWFGGGAAALLAAAVRSGARPTPVVPRAAVGGVLLAGWLCAVLAASGRMSWAPVALVGSRPALLGLFLVVFTAWFTGEALLVRRGNRGTALLLLLLSRLVVVAALLAGVFLLGAPGFLVLLLPLMVPLLALLAAAAWIASSRTADALATALVSALPLALLVSTTFPLLA